MNRRRAAAGLMLAAVFGLGAWLVWSGTRTGPSGSTTDVAAPETTVLIAQDFSWVFARRFFDARPTGTYSLQAGTLASDTPVVDIEVPMEVRPHAMEWLRIPAVASPVMDEVVYVADDGIRSEVRRIDLADPNGFEVVGILDEIVWSVVTAPGGDAAYLMTIERGGNGDAGVLRLELDGSEELTEVMEPAIPDSLAGDTLPSGEVIQFHAELWMALDGHQLARRVCADPAWEQCLLDVLDVESGTVTRLPDRMIIGIADGLLASLDCRFKTCSLSVTDLVTGDDHSVMPMAGNATMAVVDGAPVIAYSTEPDANGLTAIRGVGMRDGGTAELYRARAGDSVAVQGFFPGQEIVVVPPSHAIVVSYFSAAGHAQELGLSVTGGEPLPLPMPPVRPIDGMGK